MIDNNDDEQNSNTTINNNNDNYAGAGCSVEMTGMGPGGASNSTLSPDNNSETQKQRGFVYKMKKIYYFYQAPIVKFSCHSVRNTESLIIQ